MRLKRISLILVLFAFGCGVKGDPIPPERAPELGGGQPSFRRAFEESQQKGPSTYLDENPYEEDEDDEDEF